MAAKDPKLKDAEPFTTVLSGDRVAIAKRANGYKTFIVTGGGQDFVRTYSEHVYGVPRDQVVGDATREYAYGPESQMSPFSDALMTQAKQSGWIVVSMKDDWKRIFAWQQ